MLRRCYLIALAVGVACATAVQAQTGPGTIYYQYGSPTGTYKVAGDGTQNTFLGNFPTPGGVWSSLNTYPGGRQYAHRVSVGTVPNSTFAYCDLWLYAETDMTMTTQLTNFRGPQYTDENAGPQYRLSNDSQDRFLSFLVYDTRTGQYIFYRYNGPLSDVFAPGFVPFGSDDARLTALTTFPSSYALGLWNSSGTRITYQVGTNPPKLYVADITTGSKTLVNDPIVSGLSLPVGMTSPVAEVMYGVGTTNSGVKGIVALDLTTGGYAWVIQEGGKNNSRISSFRDVGVSPDGTTLAFGMLRVVNGKTCPALARIPVQGGVYTPLLTFPASSTNTVSPSNGWRW